VVVAANVGRGDRARRYCRPLREGSASRPAAALPHLLHRGDAGLSRLKDHLQVVMEQQMQVYHGPE
jgi:hypothetical protein